MSVVLCVVILMTVAVISYTTPVEIREIKEICHLPSKTDTQRKLQKICVTLRVLSVTLFVTTLTLGSIVGRFFALFVILMLVSQGLKFPAFSVERKLRDSIALSKADRHTSKIEPWLA